MYILKLITVFSLVCSREVNSQTCTKLGIGKDNVNKRLTGYMISDKTVSGLHECARECMFLANCKSFNFGQDDKVCEVNHADSTSASKTNFQFVLRYMFSDISLWPKTMVGSCAGHTCTGTQRCLPTKGNYICLKQECEDPPEFEHASLQPGAVTLGAVRSYDFTCPAGMILDGTSEITCGLNLKWSPLDKNCRDLKNCAEVKLCDPEYANGHYWLYPDALGGNKIKVYCYDMSTSPSEYISVDENENKGFDAGKDYTAGQLTKYSKIRINIETMQIVRDDVTFTDPPSSTLRYATGAGCNCVGGCQPWKGYFQISTLGTGLKFNNGVNWIASGYTAGVSHFYQNDENTVISAKCGGYCGWCDPDRPLILYYNENEAVDEGSAIFPNCV